MTPAPKEIRDIKVDLLARLRWFEERRHAEEERHQSVLQVIDRDEKLVKEMLEYEERQANSADKPLEQKKDSWHPNANTPLENAVLKTLSNNEIWEHSALKADLIGKGMGNEADPNFGRSLQATLLTLKNRDLVEYVGERQWKLRFRIHRRPT